MLDEFGARVLHSRARQNGRALASRFERGAGQAGQKILRTHIGQEVISADRLAGDARDDAAVRPVLAARQDIDQHRTSRLLEHLAVEGELAVLVDQPGGMSREARITIGIARGGADILPGEGEHQ